MTADPFRLDGQRVLISGAGGGIGSSLVSRFTSAGATVIGADRNTASLAHLDLAERVAFDLSDTAGTASAIEAFLAGSGIPDIVVSNAGFTRAETLDHLDLATWESEVTINLNGVYAMTAAIVEAMAARGSGNLVFISSVNGIAYFGNPAYSAAKAGMIAYSRAIALERGGQGVRSNVVAPGSVRTPAWDHRLAADPSLLAKVTPHYALGRLVTPEEVANAVLFLASPASAGITGTVLPVDAGLTAGNLRFIDDVLR